MADYLPSAPINDEAKKRNGNLPGQGGVFNVVNLHVYHYAGNNPVKYVDPEGRDFYNNSENDYVVVKEVEGFALVRPGEMFEGQIDGAVNMETGAVIKVSGTRFSPVIDVSVETIDGEDAVFLIGTESNRINYLNDSFKEIDNSLRGKGYLLSGVYDNEAVQNHSELQGQGWVKGANDYYKQNSQKKDYVNYDVREMSFTDSIQVGRYKQRLIDRK